MLRPAQLYKTELQEEYASHWYDPKYRFYTASCGHYGNELPDNNENCHCLVSVSRHSDKVIGYISYDIDWKSMSALHFGLMGFMDTTESIMEFIGDVRKCIFDLFEVYHMNRIGWLCYADNPAIKAYRSFIKRYGGKECGYLRQTAKLQDGLLHDAVMFEILASDFHHCRTSRNRDLG